MRDKIFISCLALMVICLHIFTTNFSSRSMINYDDLIWIRPMLNLSLADYFSEWLPVKANHAHPLRDMTFFADQWLSEKVQFKTYWLTNILIFLAYTLAINKIFCLYIADPRLRYLAMLVTALHPINIEIIQWLTSRKHLLVGLFIALGSYNVLKHLKIQRQMHSWSLLNSLGLYLAAILSYPTGILWSLWLAYNMRFQLKKSSWQLWVIFTIAVAMPFVCYTVLTSGSTDFNRGNNLFEWQRMLTLGLLGIGRGFYTLVLPWPLSIFYNELSPLNYIGIAITTVLFGSVFILIRKTNDCRQKASVKQLLLLAACLFIPQMLVFTTYPDFVWADRYLFIALPYTGLGALILIQDRLIITNKSTSIIGLLILFAYGGVHLIRAPLWQSHDELILDCSLREKAPKCLARAARHFMLADECEKAAAIFADFTRLKNRHHPEYQFEYFAELPFYESTCTALNTRYSGQEKLAHIENIFLKAPGSGEPVFGLVLTLLEMGKKHQAVKEALGYYLNPTTEKHFSTTRGLLNFYFGHIKALCEIAENQECERGKANFTQNYRKTLKDYPRQKWGFEITKTVWQRGQTISSHTNE